MFFHPSVKLITMQQRHVPLRQCMGCGSKLPKGELNRLVKNSCGSVLVDPTGKMQGRGAYLCHMPSCWEKSMKRNRLDYALRTSLSQDDRQRLMEYVRSRLVREPLATE
ncbi:MAG: hypothetical protein BZY82_09100 [SAR202 cluster bacterium Io17-Chloro-G3]|nr:MAG: hypothetical protein BZY82_09100 [SAR202 cluster bacterium Io17-Chloro-G3]